MNTIAICAACGRFDISSVKRFTVIHRLKQCHTKSPFAERNNTQTQHTYCFYAMVICSTECLSRCIWYMVYGIWYTDICAAISSLVREFCKCDFCLSTTWIREADTAYLTLNSQHIQQSSIFIFTLNQLRSNKDE